MSMSRKSLEITFFGFRVCLAVRSIQLAFSSRDSLRGRSFRVSYVCFCYFSNVLRVSRAVTRLTVYRPHRVIDS